MSNSDNSSESNPFGSMSEWGKAANAPANTKSTPLPPPAPPRSLLDALSPYLKRPVAEGLYYSRKIINLDGFKFVGCRFDNCKLVVSSLNFEIENCVVDPSTVVEFAGETVKIIRLFNVHNEWTYAAQNMFGPTRNADGTLTINGAPQ